MSDPAVRSESGLGVRLALVSPRLPSAIDGIGDYTACLAAELSRHVDVAVLTGEADVPSIPGVRIERAWDASRPASIVGLSTSVEREAPDWLILQYNPFSYARRGVSPQLVQAVERALRLPRAPRLALMVHEPFVPLEGLRQSLLGLAQRDQLRRLGRQADVGWFSVSPWAERFGSWFPQARVGTLPVGSTIPFKPSDPARTREGLGIAPDAAVLGLFGSGHPSRSLDIVEAAIEGVGEAGMSAALLVVGEAGRRFAGLKGRCAVLDAGVLPAAQVSAAIQAMDLYLLPFVDGVSTRRTTLMAGMLHGRACLGTRGESTGAELLEEDGRSLVLTKPDDFAGFRAAAVKIAADTAFARGLGERAAELYRRRYDWPVIARRLLDDLGATRAG